LFLGKVILYPSEGVWGLGCDPNNEEAVNKLLKIKHRSNQQGLILVGSKLSHLEKFTSLEKYFPEINKTWPGPHTWVFPSNTAPKWITGGRNSIALRLSDHPSIKLICNNFSGAIVSTSANRSGKKPIKSFIEARTTFPNLSYLPGCIGDKKGSTSIQDIVTKEWIRKRKE